MNFRPLAVVCFTTLSVICLADASVDLVPSSGSLTASSISSYFAINRSNAQSQFSNFGFGGGNVLHLKNLSSTALVQPGAYFNSLDAVNNRAVMETSATGYVPTVTDFDDSTCGDGYVRITMLGNAPATANGDQVIYYTFSETGCSDFNPLSGYDYALDNEELEYGAPVGGTFYYTVKGGITVHNNQAVPKAWSTSYKCLEITESGGTCSYNLN